MKNLIKLFSILCAVGLILVSCEGPAGPVGPAGADGTNGTDGKDGVDANQTCTMCHNNDAIIETKVAQWENSIHATGTTAGGENRSGCLQCHVSQGFLQAVATGSTSNLDIPDEPQQINCYTCHKIHTTFTAADWALTKPGAETLIVKYGGADVVYDLGTSNQCVACHQARAISSPPVKDGPDYEITSTHFGQHHGLQSNMLLGKMAYEMDGDAYPTSNPHAAGDGCVNCHMSLPHGYQAGGHSWNMTYGSSGTLNTTGCLVSGCHSSSSTLTTLLTSLHTAIEGKMDSLAFMLDEAGLWDSVEESGITGTFPANEVLNYIVFNAVEEDRSEGVHNPEYFKTLLDNSIASMIALGYTPPTK
jgi:hypothetical protein